MRGTVWGAARKGAGGARSAPRVSSRASPRLPDEFGAGSELGVLAVVLPAAAAVGVALAGLPWASIRAAQSRTRPRLRAVGAATAAVYLVAAADISAASGYPYGNRTAGRATEIANIDTRLTASSVTAQRGGHVNFAVTITSHETVTAQQLELTITLTPCFRLDGPPAYSIGSGCIGAATIVCNLDYLPAYNSTQVYFGVTVTVLDRPGRHGRDHKRWNRRLRPPEDGRHGSRMTTYLPGDRGPQGPYTARRPDALPSCMHMGKGRQTDDDSGGGGSPFVRLDRGARDRRLGRLRFDTSSLFPSQGAVVPGQSIAGISIGMTERLSVAKWVMATRSAPRAARSSSGSSSTRAPSHSAPR